MNTAPAARAVPVLDLSRLTIELGGRRILDGVDVQVAAGEFVGLIGTNGTGKTTLMRAVLGEIPIASGTSRVLGRARPRAGDIGYVPQRIDLDPDLPLRARDLVALGLDGHRFGPPIRRHAFWTRVEDALRGVGALDLADRPVGRLSGGQQQRVLIASAIVSDPALLLLDEPLANLDPANSADVVQLLDGIRRAEGIAIVLSAHDVNPLLPVLDRVVYLGHGHAAVGPLDEVIRADVLTRLYRHPIEVLRARGHLIVLAAETEEHHRGHDQLTGDRPEDAS